MQWLRNTWMARGVVALVVTSLVALLFASAESSPRRAPSYADWVRAQLLHPAGEAVEQALQTASENHQGSLQDFLDAFIDAYEAAHPQGTAAQVFVAHDLSNDALITYLQGRYSRVVGEALLPRTTITVATPSHSTSPAQQKLSAGTVAELLSVKKMPTAGVRAEVARLVIIPLRWLWDAQPLGP